MNTEYINNTEFTNSPIYQSFLNNNKGVGFLMIRASAASEAIPISNLKIVVSKQINGNKVIFFDGVTNSSGMIERISLPAPVQDENNLDIPRFATYDIEATYEEGNIKDKYNVNIYNGLITLQKIIVTPSDYLSGDYLGY